MEKLTKKQRNEVYRKALRLFNNPIKLDALLIQKTYHQRFNTCGICQVIDVVMGYNGALHMVREVFEELNLFIPDGEYKSFWFENQDERKIVCSFLIEMTNPNGAKTK